MDCLQIWHTIRDSYKAHICTIFGLNTTSKIGSVSYKQFFSQNMTPIVKSSSCCHTYRTNCLSLAAASLNIEPETLCGLIEIKEKVTENSKKLKHLHSSCD